MNKHLVIVVHGIGEQIAGETVDELCTAATTRHPDGDEEHGEISSTEISLAEADHHKDNRNLKLFPCHIRRVKSKPTDSNQVADEAVFAEVFWADLSPAPKGPIWTFVDLLSMILGLGYLALDNVHNNLGKAGRIGKLSVHAFVWLFYLLIAPLNALLLIGAGFLLIDIVAPIGSEGAIAPRKLLLMMGFFTVLTGAVMQSSAFCGTYLLRLFWRGLLLLGLLTILAALASNSSLAASICGGVPENDEDLFYVSCFIANTVQALGAVWVMTILLSFLMIVGVLIGFVGRFLKWLKRKQHALRHRANDAGAKDDTAQANLRQLIYPGISAAMLVLWMIFSSAFWVGLQKLVEQSTDTVKKIQGPPTDGDGTPRPFLLAEIFKDHLEQALGTLGFAALALVVILLMIGIVLFFRRVLRNRTAPFLRKLFVDRLILNLLLDIAFIASSLLLMVGIVILLFGGAGDPENCDLGSDLCAVVVVWTEVLDAYFGIILMGILGVAALIYYFSEFVGSALGIARDIIAYSIRNRCNFTGTLEDNYPQRARIEARFSRVVNHMLDTETFDHLTVFSHSQGTVIATRNLCEDRASKTGLMAKIKDVSGAKCLITMGSPVTHIYLQYFSADFGITRADILPDFRWHNIYRKDDFVGTTIDFLATPDLPCQNSNNAETGVDNRSAGFGGHTGYFTDYLVWQELLKTNLFQLFRKPRSS
ncbi:V-type ATP synthase subunit I domain-containing protein [Sedimentitalea todarodis]|uniref:Alpha/beta hydrolase n=1 Tax=Sedimentitalea todarodis TaxID=1631240 RepID=A0ABU3VDT3_9RHOB|nr:hypothetical protein [Sedimentitalea todarodis]MDU9004321.1 hypothetical protein [Sedimentitalea todarodis]